MTAKKKVGRPAMPFKEKKMAFTVSLTATEQKEILKEAGCKTLTEVLKTYLKPQDNDTKK